MSKTYSKFPAGIKIGVSWEVSSVRYRQTFVRSGEYSGIMLSELYRDHPELFGTSEPFFPMVVKLLDINETPPVRVIGTGVKDDASQTEIVYIIDADPLSRMVSGTDVKTSIELLDAIATDNLEKHLNYTDIKKGDCFAVPPGTLYALGGGILAFTVDSPLLETSDVYDWKGYGEMNIDKAIDSFRYDFSVEKTAPIIESEKRTKLIESGIFCVELIDASSGYAEAPDDIMTCYTALESGAVSYGTASRTYLAGDTFLLPAGMDQCTLIGGSLVRVKPKIRG